MTKIYKYRYQLIIFLIAVALFWLNYQPGTYLSGWDNLQTELNPELAVKRAFYSVWEEYQSFGLTAGMAHATDLIRAILLWFASYLLPQNMIRYFYHFLMLLLGGIGMMRLLLHQSADRHEIISFLGALFYLFNLGTMQMFYLPFEAFSSFFAFLPWGLWSFLRVISIRQLAERNPARESSEINQKYASLDSSTAPSSRFARSGSARNDLIIFSLINLLGSASFYTQALFAVYLLALFCLTASTFISSRFSSIQMKINLFKKTSLIFILIFILNSYWILPQIYFLKTNGRWITMSKANQLATERTYRQNLEKGSIDNFLRLEGFYLDAQGIKNQSLFLAWNRHFSGWKKILPNFFAFLMIIGLYENLRKKRYAFIFIFIICSIALLSATPPFSWLNNIVRDVTYINQIFRSPFTKFIILYSLVYSFFVSQGIRKILKARSYIVSNLFLASCFFLIIFYSLPSFRGFFISPEMKIKIPSDYLKLIYYFKNEDKNKRIALLPDYTFWGWFFHKWGYNGSGFLWYGIEQPIVSRTFDVWSSSSESYFWEQKLAIEAEDLARLESIYEKYNIDYLMLDRSLIPVVSNYKSLQIDRIENMLAKSKRMSAVYQNKYFTLYKLTPLSKIDKFVTLSTALSNIGPTNKILSDDSAFQELGYYQSDRSNPYSIYYPYLDLTTHTRLEDKSWNIVESENTFTINSKFDSNQVYKNLFMLDKYDARLLINEKLEDIRLNLTSSFANNNLAVNFEKKLIKSFAVSNLDYEKDIAFSIADLPQKYSYLVKVRTRNLKGPRFYFYITDETKKQAAIEDNLRKDIEYFILPAKYQYGLGYSFIFQKPKYDNLASQNIIEEITIYLLPYENLKLAKLYGSTSPARKPIFLNNFQVEKINYFTYKISLNPGQEINNLILHQSFDPGWLAISKGKILDHFKINNWANGWRLNVGSDKFEVGSKNLQTSNLQPQTSNIVVIFWPQYLQFAGFVLLIIAFIYIIKTKQIQS